MYHYLNADQSYQRALFYYERKNYDQARKWFQTLLRDEKYQKNALLKLVRMDFLEGKLLSARDLLMRYAKDLNSDFCLVFGYLEKMEYNFDRSKENYQIGLNNSRSYYNSILELGRLAVQMGDYEQAQVLLNTTCVPPYYALQLEFEKVYLAILQKDYEKAENLLNKMDRSLFTREMTNTYRNIQYYLMSLSSNFDHEYFYSKYCSDMYTVHRIFFDDEETLISHIKKHCNPIERYSNGYFLENIDFKKLIDSVQKRITTCNPIHHYFSDIYHLQLPFPIGYKGDMCTSDIRVVTLLGNKKIITMFPVLLSNHFNLENRLENSSSQENRTRKMIGS